MSFATHLLICVFADCWTGMLSSDSEQTASATSSSSKLRPRVISKVINCACEQNFETPPLIQVLSCLCSYAYYLVQFVPYPHYAMLVQVLAMPMCLSVTSQCSIETAEWIELFFLARELFLPILKEIQVSYKNRSTLFWNFFLNSRRRKFCHSISIVKTCYQLCSRKFHMKVYHSVRQALCTAWFHRTGQLATADTVLKIQLGMQLSCYPFLITSGGIIIPLFSCLSSVYLVHTLMSKYFDFVFALGFDAVGWAAGRASGL